MVFQNYALYPHMTVEKNISYGLKNMKVPKDEIKKKTEWAIDILGLEEYRNRKPKNLSGGQRQSLTLLMASIANPKLLLLDEHTAALDPAAAAKVLELTNRVASREGMCTLMITHNMKDALHYGNRTILMKNGKIVMELAGEERKAMTVEKLIEKFSIDNDRMLL